MRAPAGESGFHSYCGAQFSVRLALQSNGRNFDA